MGREVDAPPFHERRIVADKVERRNVTVDEAEGKLEAMRFKLTLQ